MNDKYYGERVRKSQLGNLGLELANSQYRLISQEYEIELLRIIAAHYRAFFFHNWDLGKKLQKQREENEGALVGEFDGFCYASWRASAVFRTLEDMYNEGLLTEDEYRECKII